MLGVELLGPKTCSSLFPRNFPMTSTRLVGAT